AAVLGAAVAASQASATDALPNLVPVSISRGWIDKVGHYIDVRVRNDGFADAPATKVFVYGSRDRRLSPDDVRLAGHILIDSIPTGQQRERAMAGVKRTRYLIACVDPTDRIPEMNEGDNCLAARVARANSRQSRG